MHLSFEASEFRRDGGFDRRHFEFQGSEDQGWQVFRDGALTLELGPGYRALRVERCGVCSTDLARQHLPFPLPQIIGHELVAMDPAGRPQVIEINASHAARGIDTDCPFCAEGLATHCPERLVLGIDQLPGGFGEWVLAAAESIVRVPDSVHADAAVLVEPFAAALNAVRMTTLQDGDRVGVLGPRRLGMLLIAALAGERERRGLDFEIIAIARRSKLNERALSFGADRSCASAEKLSCEVLFDTTGNPTALDQAVEIAKRELHIKSTHGQAASGLRHLTEAVVDELRIARWDGHQSHRLAWLAASPPPSWVRPELIGRDATSLQAQCDQLDRIPRVDAVVVEPHERSIDAVIRPTSGREESLVRPRGTIYLDPQGSRGASSIVEAIVERAAFRIDESLR